MFNTHSTLKPELEESEEKAYDYALKLLTRREYSRHELYQKLAKRYVKAVALKTLRHCIEANLQSDERYADMLVRHMSYQGYGPLKFVQSCRKQGIESSIYQPLVEDTDWLTLALEVLRHKAPHYLDSTEPDTQPSYAQRQKIMAMLYRRGFPAALVAEAFESYTRSV
ncbi:MAG: recombination regulator RecX [Succinivibrio sp.]|nr:recombination regulator RecX [Succinivibrio sp.]